MQLREREIVLAHEPDAAWIIALWKAIHGGDPAPEISAQRAEFAATEAIRGLASRLSLSKQKAVEAALR